MASVRELTLRLSAETKGMSKGVEDVNGKMSKMGGMLKGAAAGMAAAFTVDKVVEFGKAAIDEASSVAESVSKIGQVFGEQAGAAEKFARRANTSLGLSDRQATEMVGTLGNMFTGMGKGKQEALGLSEGTMQLAADLGSFNNLGTDEVVDMMSSAFRGEYDSIQRVLPGISGAAVAQEALAQTGKTSADQLTEGEKSMAAYALMMKQAGPAVGDFARTSDGAANKQKILQSKLDDTKASIGTALLPAWTAVLNILADKVIPALIWFGNFLGGPFLDFMQKAGEFIWKYLEAPFNAVMTIVRGVWDFLFNFVMFVYDIFTGKWGDAWQRVLGMFKAVWDILKGYIQLFWIYIQTAWNIIWTVIKTVGGKIWGAIIWPFVTAFDAIKSAWNTTWDAIKTAWNGVSGFFSTVGSAIKDAITWPFRAAWDFIKRTWNNTLGKIKFTVPKWIPGIGGNKFEFPQLAKGGIVTRPTLALIGERGPEAVVPLGKVHSGSGGNTYNISVTAGVGDKYEIGRQVVDAIQSFERIAGPRVSGARGGTA